MRTPGGRSRRMELNSADGAAAFRRKQERRESRSRVSGRLVLVRGRSKPDAVAGLRSTTKESKTVEGVPTDGVEQQASGASSEDAYSTDYLDLCAVEPLVELRLEAVEVVVVVGERAVAVEPFHHPSRPRGVAHATAQNGAAEHDAARRERRLAVIEDDTLGHDVTRQAVQQPVQADGVERPRRQCERLQRIRLMRLGLVPVQAFGSDFKRDGVEIHQRDVGRLGRIAALVEQVPGSHANVEMVSRDVLVVEPNEPPWRTAPGKMTVESQNYRVVNPQEAGRVASLSGIRGVVRREGSRNRGDYIPSRPRSTTAPSADRSGRLRRRRAHDRSGRRAAAQVATPALDETSALQRPA